jgi:energy-coupling factor transporter ATP-binding protein EcfA2
VVSGPPRATLDRIDLAPPVVRLGRSMGWTPLPLSLEESGRFTAGIRPARWTSQGGDCSAGPLTPLLSVRDVSFAYDTDPVLKNVTLEVGGGELLALMGRNGSAKTTLLKCVVGLLRPGGGEILLENEVISARPTSEICRAIGYLPQEPDALLFADSVEEELRVTLRNHGLLSGQNGNPDRGRLPLEAPQLLKRLGLEGLASVYPRDLSVGQRQRVALGAVTVTRPRLLLLDEPTRGMDYFAKRELVRLLREWQVEGTGILLVTHDVELAAEAADRIAVLDEGRIVADGPPVEVFAASPLFAPQVARLFPGSGWLTVEDALTGLGVSEAA